MIQHGNDPLRGHGFWTTKKMKDGSFYAVRCRWKPIVIGIHFLSLIAVLAGLVVVLCVSGGCEAPRQAEPNPALVFHVGGTLYNPEIYPEYSRNDKYLNVRTDEELASERERYLQHLSLIIESTDRQRTSNGKTRDHFSQTTRIKTK